MVDGFLNTPLTVTSLFTDLRSLGISSNYNFEYEHLLCYGDVDKDCSDTTLPQFTTLVVVEPMKLH